MPYPRAMKSSAFAACLLLLSTSVAAFQGPPRPARPEPQVRGPAKSEPLPSVADEGGGEPTCGLGKEFHAGRRAELARRLKSGVVIVRGLPDTRDYTVFRQDKNFWYLTGIESPNATLVMDIEGGTTTLFLPTRKEGNESWEGEKWDHEDPWVAELCGIADVRPTGELLDSLKDLMPAGRKVWITKEPHLALSGCYDRAEPYDRKIANDPLDGRRSREEKLAENLKARFQVEVADMRYQLSEMRRVKTAEELAALEQCGRIGAMAMVEAMRSTAPGRGEWELGALMQFVHVREGAAGPGYDAIVGSGRNSCVLHYNTNRRRMQAGEVLLIDFAPEYEHMVVDITRTWPVNGRFNERQAQLYDAVLAAQQAGIAAAKPGATIADVERACGKALKDAGFQSLQRHGACHWVGMEVHDVGDYAQPLVPGCAFTIEPGLYDEAAGIGVRIEDVVVITAEGNRVITAGVPRERAAIEALIGDPGLLDASPAK